MTGANIYPVRSLLVVPSDWELWLAEHPSAVTLAEAAFKDIRAWLERETGYTYDLTFDVLIYPLSAAEMLPPGTDPVAPFGPSEGVLEDHVWNAFRLANRWDVDANGVEVGRKQAIVLNGGGWAGARGAQNIEGGEINDPGYALGWDSSSGFFGDWHFRFAVLGVTSPGCVFEYGQDFCRNDFRIGLGHEILHGFFVPCVHADDTNPACAGSGPHSTGYPEPLSAPQKAAFIRRNAQFIRPVAATPAPVPVPEPVPPPPPPPPKVLASLSLQPHSVSLRVGKTAQLALTATYDDGTRESVPGLWTLYRKTGVVSVTDSGLVTALKRGSTMVVATYGGLSDAATITVTRW